ncbi:Pre-mRNA-splicing factor [Teratosphaeria destructans]|uniref:Copper transport protein n=1 Tax=Teratosphaeria destructans TaxID=418781 RepID=A0A9W7SQ10_9PEZI|nr:Pre-mRNA-splicing factor [Teratosphaeria destructans]
MAEVPVGRPWRVGGGAQVAVLDTVLAGVGYLLMVAVMTMNVGYFMSVLAGAFVGSFVFGGWTGPADAHTGCC